MLNNNCQSVRTKEKPFEVEAGKCRIKQNTLILGKKGNGSTNEIYR